MNHKGSCHCGKIAYEVEGEFQEVIECNCSNCSRRGYLLWFVPAAKFTLKTPEGNMAHYTFNKHRIKHYFCPACGSAPFGMGEDGKGNRTVAVNVRCLEGVDPRNLKIKFVDGRSL
ncbi:MAG: GFA family protein [Gammaproteobacteria bacterium]